MPATWILLNPDAGEGTDPAEFAVAVREHLDVHTARIASTAVPGEARRRALEAARQGAARVVAAGGDGTVREVVEGLLDHGAGAGETPVLGIVPLGTGNDLARCLGVPLDLDGALEFLAGDPRVRPLDVLRVSLDGSVGWAANAVVVGEGGRVGRALDADEKAFWGPLSYLRSAVEMAFEVQPVAVRWAVDDGEPHEAPVLNVVMANGVTAGGGIPIAPGADPGDGMLDFAVVGDVPMAEVVAIGAALLAGRDPGSEAWSHRRGRRVRVESPGGDPLPVSVDGENGAAAVVEVEVLSGRLRVHAAL